MSSSKAGLYLTEHLLAEDVAAGFSCGNHSLDDYFARHALPNQQAGISNTYVLRGASADLPKIVGFYTLSMFSIASAQASVVLAKKLPRYPIPVALLGRLAVHERAQGRGFGAALLGDALHKISDSARIISCVGAVVDAKDELAEKFYLKYGFVLMEKTDWPHRLFISISTLRIASGE